jgi:KUP system potassium uptake protein
VAASLLVACGLFGAALIYGDGLITTAISVLSALEGVNVATDLLKPYVLPASLVILLGLFAVQPRGTASIGRVFGPVMLLWFVTIAVLGLLGAVNQPKVATAIDPRHAIGFLAELAGTVSSCSEACFGDHRGEALYADMVTSAASLSARLHRIVLPALLLSYAGRPHC